MKKGVDDKTGAGRVNAFRAVQMAKQLGNENNTRMMPKKKDWAEVIDAGGSKEDPGQKKSKEDWEEVLE